MDARDARNHLQISFRKQNVRTRKSNVTFTFGNVHIDINVDVVADVDVNADAKVSTVLLMLLSM